MERKSLQTFPLHVQDPSSTVQGGERSTTQLKGMQETSTGPKTLSRPLRAPRRASAQKPASTLPGLMIAASGRLAPLQPCAAARCVENLLCSDSRTKSVQKIMPNFAFWKLLILMLNADTIQCPVMHQTLREASVIHGSDESFWPWLKTCDVIEAL